MTFLEFKNYNTNSVLHIKVSQIESFETISKMATGVDKWEYPTLIIMRTGTSHLVTCGVEELSDLIWQSEREN